MGPVQRNQLVWLSASGWQAIHQHDWDAEARTLLDHWQAQQFPLVVTRQRPGAPEHTISLGLPAPAQWQRRRLALDADRAHIARHADFPELQILARAAQWPDALIARAQQLQALGIHAQVYGSFGWQWLTGLDYVHAASDLDVRIAAPNLAGALALAGQLAHTGAGLRLDGELVLPCGWAMAWREVQQLASGNTFQVLVRDRLTLRLADLAELQTR